ncbi:MAG: glycosyltransferase, partial [bacterium]|nr:glycosyltransferase [bacterium]
IQPHKGFERAIEAFRRVPDPRLRLKIVGSVRLAWDKIHAYARLLHELADADPRCEVVEGYLGDELFDTWIVAADYVLLPYHEIWTSAVAARAALYRRPMIAARIGGIVEQLTEGSASFANDAELVDILRAISARHGAQPFQPATTDA